MASVGIPPLATDNLLENTDGVLRPTPSEHPISVLSGGSLLPSTYADGRSPDDVTHCRCRPRAVQPVCAAADARFNAVQL